MAALVHFRHPNEVGGAYFTFNLVVNLSLGAFAAKQYAQHENCEDDGCERRWNADTVVATMASACAGIVFSYLVLLCSIKKEYLRSFFSMKTSSKSLQETFTNSTEDKYKIEIFSANRDKWEHTIGREVNVWIDEALPVWLEQRPAWFTDERMSIICEDFVTDPVLYAMIRKSKTSSANRRKSIIDIAKARHPSQRGKSRKCTFWCEGIQGGPWA